MSRSTATTTDQSRCRGHVRPRHRAPTGKRRSCRDRPFRFQRRPDGASIGGWGLEAKRKLAIGCGGKFEFRHGLHGRGRGGVAGIRRSPRGSVEACNQHCCALGLAAKSLPRLPRVPAFRSPPSSSRPNPIQRHRAGCDQPKAIAIDGWSRKSASGSTGSQSMAPNGAKATAPGGRRGRAPDGPHPRVRTVFV